jgi:hypothetical protein
MISHGNTHRDLLHRTQIYVVLYVDGLRINGAPSMKDPAMRSYRVSMLNGTDAAECHS